MKGYWVGFTSKSTVALLHFKGFATKDTTVQRSFHYLTDQLTWFFASSRTRSLTECLEGISIPAPDRLV